MPVKDKLTSSALPVNSAMRVGPSACPKKVMWCPPPIRSPTPLGVGAPSASSSSLLLPIAWRYTFSIRTPMAFVPSHAAPVESFVARVDWPETVMQELEM